MTIIKKTSSAPPPIPARRSSFPASSTARTEIKWDRSLSIGVPKIDLQHQGLFRSLAALSDSIRQGQGLEAVMTTLGTLTQYTIEHFQTEETLMNTIAKEGLFPRFSLDAHVSQHELFKSDIALLTAQAKTIGINELLAKQVEARIHFWLRNHISVSDQQLGRYLSR